jgi:hypothetical protein
VPDDVETEALAEAAGEGEEGRQGDFVLGSQFSVLSSQFAGSDQYAVISGE